MNWPFVSRRQYDELALRVLDIEKHFVTRRNEQGQVVETLADVPLAQRKERKLRMGGMTWQQRKQVLEATDGGRLLNHG